MKDWWGIWKLEAALADSDYEVGDGGQCPKKRLEGKNKGSITWKHILASSETCLE